MYLGKKHADHLGSVLLNSITNFAQPRLKMRDCESEVRPGTCEVFPGGHDDCGDTPKLVKLYSSDIHSMGDDPGRHDLFSGLLSPLALVRP